MRNDFYTKNAGFIILLTSIFTFFFFGEIRNLTTLCLLPLVYNGFSLSSFFLSLLSFLWIGAQFPQEKFLSYGRIFTLHYYFLLMCILFSSFRNCLCQISTLFFFLFLYWIYNLFLICYILSVMKFIYFTIYNFSIAIFLKSYGYLSFLSFTICILFHSRHTSFHCG